MGKIVFFEMEDWEKAHIEKSLPSAPIVIRSDKLNEHTVDEVADATIVSVFIYSQLDKTLLSKMPNLKLITTRSTGYDHIDMNYCKEKGIVVTNVPTYGAHTVAEHTFALILALTRKIIPSVERTRRGDFTLTGLSGMDLFGKTLGVVGSGNIGKRVIAIAQCFGMQVVVHARHEDPELVESGVKFVSLDELLAQSDIVTLHVPSSGDTKHMINMENIGKFKKGSMLINTSRGAIVETQAILQGLEQGTFAGVGLDVLEEECELREERELMTSEFLAKCDLKTQLLNHVLLTRSDVIMTPHNAFNSQEALQQILETTAQNIKAFIAGAPQNTVG